MKKIRRATVTSKKTRSVKLAHAKRPVLRHLRLVEHKHTGKLLLHPHHSSYIALIGILVIVGFFLVISQHITKADNTSTVTAVVNAPPPTVGAVITSPLTGTTIANVNPSEVDGTCVSGLYVIVYDNGILGGSTICTAAGIFGIKVQLNSGSNILTARNFDNLNQPGPSTPAVTVTFNSEDAAPEVPKPNLPETPVIIPGLSGSPSECDSYSPTGTFQAGGQPHVAVVCVPQSITPNEDHKIGVLVWGGTPPYALNFQWGSGNSTLISMDAPGYRTVPVHYASSGIYNINIQLTDQGESSATGQSAVQVTGASSAPQTFTQAVSSILSTSWFQTPVPLYVIAVGLTLGFWGGDVFHRRFGAKAVRKRAKRA